MILNLDIQLNKTQSALLSLVENNKFTVANISRQQGKSVLAKVLATTWLFQTNKVISYITPTLKLAKKIFKDLTSVLPAELLVTCNASDLVIESVTGSSLWFYSAEQGDKIRGITNNYLIIDEAAFLKNGTDLWYSILSPTIKVKGEKILFISTPNGTNNIFYELAIKAQSRIKDWAYIMRDIYSDSFCENIEEIREQTPDIIFRQEYLCEFIEGATSFFTNYHQCYDNTMVFNWKSPLWAGIDWSSTGKDKTVITFINAEGQVQKYNIEGDLDKKYEQIASIINQRKPRAVYAETNSIGEVMLNELNKLLKKKAKGFLTTNDSKTEIIGELAVALERGDITYNDIELDRQLGAYGYSVTKTNKLSFAGVGEHDDATMSLAFALRAKKDFSVKSSYTFI